MSQLVYLLTQAEYDAMGKPAEQAIEYLRNLVVGDNCIHKHPRYQSGFTYCCQCPLSDLGEGKNKPSHALSKLLCNFPREYSK